MFNNLTWFKRENCNRVSVQHSGKFDKLTFACNQPLKFLVTKSNVAAAFILKVEKSYLPAML